MESRIAALKVARISVESFPIDPTDLHVGLLVASDSFKKIHFHAG